MVIKGSARGGSAELAKHLQRTDENERVTLIRIHGLAARDLRGALVEMDALGTGLQTRRTLYHVSINVGPRDSMTDERWQTASAVLREKLDLAGQPYVEVEHKKKGRIHRHLVIARTDLEHMRAIRADHNYRKHEEVARALEREFGHERVQGAHAEREGKDRPPRTPNAPEQQQAKRTGLTPKEAKAFITELWEATDSGKALQAALENHGWLLARGDKTTAKGHAYLMVIDPHGGQHQLARRVEGVKAAAVHARMSDVEPATLPSMRDARALQERQATVREFASEAETIAKVSPRKDSPSEPQASVPNERVAATAEACHSPQASPFAPSRRSDASTTAVGLSSAELRPPAKTSGRFLDGLARTAESILGGIFSFFEPSTPKLSPQLAQDLERANANDETRHARDVAKAAKEREVAWEWQEHAEKTQRQQKDLRIAQSLGLPPTSEANLGHSQRDDRDQDRER